MRLTGAIVTYDKHALVVDRFIERKLRDHLFGNPLRHAIGYDVGCDESRRRVGPVCIEQLNDRFNRLELYEIPVAHVFSSLTLFFNFKWDQAIQAVVLIFRMPHLGIGQSTINQLPWP